MTDESKTVTEIILEDICKQCLEKRLKELTKEDFVKKFFCPKCPISEYKKQVNGK